MGVGDIVSGDRGDEEEIMMKKCTGCSLVLGVENFNKDNGKADGLYPYCKACRVSMTKKYNETHRESRRRGHEEYYRANKEKCLAMIKRWHNSESGKEHHRRSGRRQLIRNPEKVRARGMLRYNVWLNKIAKPDSCEACGITGVRICGHHHNGYSKEHRYDVRWLCDTCHRQAHLLKVA